MMDFSKPGCLIDGNKDRNMVRFEYVDKTWCMVDGRNIARKYGYTKPTFVYLYYRLEKNEFLMFDRVFHKIIQNSNSIPLSSESDSTDDNETDEEDETDNDDDSEEVEDSDENGEEDETDNDDDSEEVEDSDENGEEDDNEVDEADDVEPNNLNEFEVFVSHALANTKSYFCLSYKKSKKIK
jgi:hypothetical protein